MSTSGDTSWQLVRDSIIQSAYRKLGYLALDQTLTATEITNGAEALNMVVTNMVTKGMPLWKRTFMDFTPLATTQTFTVPAAIKVAQVVLRNTGGNQWPLIEKSRYDFNMLPQGAGPGLPVHYTAKPTVPNGYTVEIWPLTADTGTIATNTIRVVYQKQFDDFVSATDNLDFPNYWTLPIVLKLALTLAPETGLALQDRQFIQTEYQMALADCLGYGDEDGSLYAQPDFMGRRVS